MHLGLLVLLCGVEALVGPQRLSRPSVVRKSDDGLECPSDVADDYEAEGPFEVESPSDVAAAVDTGACSEGALLRLVAPTSRGAVADFDDRLAIDSYCAELEASRAAAAPGALNGVWNLAYCSEPGLYRSSPFFWGFSQLLGDKSAGMRVTGSSSEGLADNIYAITDAIPFYSIGKAVQTISGAESGSGTLVSEVTLAIKIFDALLPSAQSTMTTTARSRPSPSGLALTLEKTEVKDSTIARLPGLGFVSNLAFPTEDAFQTLAGALSLNDQSANIQLLATYTSENLRITRTEGGQLFVHTRA